MAQAFEAVRITGIEHDAPLRARIEKLMMGAVKRITFRPVRSVAAFFDDNGPKGGPAMRCALTVSLPRRPAIRVEHRAESFDLAFKMAFAALERQIGPALRPRSAGQAPSQEVLRGPPGDGPRPFSSEGQAIVVGVG